MLQERQCRQLDVLYEKLDGQLTWIETVRVKYIVASLLDDNIVLAKQHAIDLLNSVTNHQTS